MSKSRNIWVQFELRPEPSIVIDKYPTSQRDNEQMRLDLADAEALHDQLGRVLRAVRAAQGVLEESA